MSGQPLPKALELILELNKIRSRDELDFLSLKRIERAAKKIFDADPGNAYQILGMIATIEGELEGMRKNFKYALEVSPDNPSYVRNFSASLAHLGFSSEAREVLKPLYESQLAVPEFSHEFINRNFRAGRFREAVKLIEERERVMPEKPHDTAEEIKKCADFVVGQTISDKDVENLTLGVQQFLHSQGVFRGNTFLVAQDDESKMLFGLILLRSTLEEVVDLRFKLAAHLANRELPEKIAKAIHFHLRSRDATADGNQG